MLKTLQQLEIYENMIFNALIYEELTVFYLDILK
jgi:hypothetical protein